jgi:hypothetical protein
MKIKLILFVFCFFYLGISHQLYSQDNRSTNRSKSTHRSKSIHRSKSSHLENSSTESRSIREGKRWRSAVNLPDNIQAILTKAFDEDYDNNPHEAGAYNFYGGKKGMDWWTFPWDLSSSKGAIYTISFADMLTMINYVEVRSNPNSETFIRYSEMIKDMVNRLDPKIMANHGGALRVAKIIYFVRNFLWVALQNKVNPIDIENLKIAAQGIIAIFKTGSLPMEAEYRGVNPIGQKESRTPLLGIFQLQKLLDPIKNTLNNECFDQGKEDNQ